MAKQLLLYETAVPISAARHADVCVEPNESFAFSAGVNAVPLMAVEFPRASAEFAIVFTAEGDNVLPAVVLGVKNAQNLYLSTEARWKADYIPAFIRRYPFVFSSSGDGKTLTLCIDESHPGVNRQGKGNALFSADGKTTPYVAKVLEFLKEFQIQFERTRQFCRRLRELQLLEPIQANVTTPQGEQFSLVGFMGVSRDKLRNLDGETLQKLASSDELELLYLHMASLRNFNEVKDRLIDAESGGSNSTTGQPTAESEAPASQA